VFGEEFSKNTVLETFTGLLNNFPKFHGDWMNGVVMHKGQIDICSFLYIYRFITSLGIKVTLIKYLFKTTIPY